MAQFHIKKKANLPDSDSKGVTILSSVIAEVRGEVKDERDVSKQIINLSNV